MVSEEKSPYQTLSPLWGLIEYHRATGDSAAHAAAETKTITLGVLSIFRRIEMRIPTEIYARHAIRFARRLEGVQPEKACRQLHGTFFVLGGRYGVAGHRPQSPSLRARACRARRSGSCAYRPRRPR